MQIDWAMLCDVCQIKNGVGNILGAGIDVLVGGPLPPGLHPLPAPGSKYFVAFVFATRLLLARNEFGRSHKLGIKIIDADGGEVGDIRADFTPDPYVDTGAPAGILFGNVFALPIQFTVKDFGQFSLDISVDGVPAKSLPFHIVSQLPQQHS